MKVKLYVEGGGDSRPLHIACRRGFSKLLEKAGFKGRMPKLIPSGGRDSALHDFKIALETASDGEYLILLVDSEAAVTQSAWEHLQKQGWQRPNRATDDQAQLMVQCMETWCVADRGTLERFFGQGYQESALLPPNNLEARAKDDIQEALEHATRKCGRDREYRKGKRSFELLAELDADLLKEHLPHFAKLCNVLTEKLDA